MWPLPISRIFAASALLLICSATGFDAGAVAQGAPPAWPSRPVRIVVPFPAGGATDILSRAFSQKFTEIIGQSVVVENKPGAGGTIGSEAVARSNGDGYTLLMATSSTHSIGPVLNPKLPYDPVKDFAPVAYVAFATNVLVVTPALPAKNVAELIALAKAKPGTLNYASSGNGTLPHLTGAYFKSMAKIDIQHVPYKGTALSFPDLATGQVNMLFDSVVSAMPQVKSGAFRALATTGAQRSALVPDLPTVAESGLPGYESTTWFGLFAPASTDKQLVQRISEMVLKAMQDNALRAKFGELGAEVTGQGPAEFARLVADERAKWTRVISDNGIKLDQ